MYSVFKSFFILFSNKFFNFFLCNREKLSRENLYFIICKFTQNPIRNGHKLVATNSDFEASELISAKFGDNITKAVLTAMTSLVAKANFAKFHINIIRNHKNIFKWNFVKIH